MKLYTNEDLSNELQEYFEVSVEERLDKTGGNDRFAPGARIKPNYNSTEELKSNEISVEENSELRESDDSDMKMQGHTD